ncbi:MAG: hypothetical protein RIR18_1854, partial [Pseudomonadota bacterium]
GIFFCFRHKEDHLKTGRQLAAGAICLLASLAMLYGAGPSMVRYMANKMMAEQAVGAGTGVVAPPPTQVETGAPSSIRP